MTEDLTVEGLLAILDAEDKPGTQLIISYQRTGMLHKLDATVNRTYPARDFEDVANWLASDPALLRAVLTNIAAKLRAPDPIWWETGPLPEAPADANATLLIHRSAIPGVRGPILDELGWAGAPTGGSTTAQRYRNASPAGRGSEAIPTTPMGVRDGLPRKRDARSAIPRRTAAIVASTDDHVRRGVRPAVARVRSEHRPSGRRDRRSRCDLERNRVAGMVRNGMAALTSANVTALMEVKTDVPIRPR